MVKITKEQAGQFLVLYHGLNGEYQYKTKEDILSFIERVGSIQFDPLNIVGRNPDLVLQSRVKKYNAKMLQELLYKDRLLLDVWDKEMSIYPITDWPYFERNRKAALERYKNIQDIKDCLPYVRETIKANGPVTSSDLELEQVIDWSWAPTRLSRAVLESMYLWGELIIYDKINTRKIYDFADKYISKSILEMDDPNKTLEQYHDWHVLRRIGAVGLLWNKASDAWLGIKEMKSAERTAAVKRLLDQKMIVELNIEGLKYPVYMNAKHEKLLETVRAQEAVKSRGAILAPLDNMLWDRNLIKEIFGFEYRWEVYKPAAQRKYGYYVLPVLYGSSFAARFEPVLDKETNALVIKNWWWEHDIKITSKMLKELRRCMKSFLNFTGAERILIDQSAPTAKQLDWLQN